MGRDSGWCCGGVSVVLFSGVADEILAANCGSVLRATRSARLGCCGVLVAVRMSTGLRGICWGLARGGGRGDDDDDEEEEGLPPCVFKTLDVRATVTAAVSTVDE